MVEKTKSNHELDEDHPDSIWNDNEKRESLATVASVAPAGGSTS